MGEVPVSHVMDALEERAEASLRVLEALESAHMMRVTREAILASLDDEQRRERERFGALRQTGEMTLEAVR